jgi:hypothetical protein
MLAPQPEAFRLCRVLLSWLKRLSDSVSRAAPREKGSRKESLRDPVGTGHPPWAMNWNLGSTDVEWESDSVVEVRSGCCGDVITAIHGPSPEQAGGGLLKLKRLWKRKTSAARHSPQVLHSAAAFNMSGFVRG